MSTNGTMLSRQESTQGQQRDRRRRRRRRPQQAQRKQRGHRLIMCSPFVVLLLCTLTLLLFQPTMAQNIFQTDECVIGDVVFQRGDPLGSTYETLCGSHLDFPCFCNPDLVNQVECPYCGFRNGAGTLYCAKGNETIVFPDGSINRSCFCQIPDNPANDPIKTCTVITTPVDNPSPAPDSGVNPSGGNCEFTNFEGDFQTFSDGDILPADFSTEGVCGDIVSWPLYCSAPPGSDSFDYGYPYCAFPDAAPSERGPVCARDGEVVEYTKVDGRLTTCSCSYLASGPVTECTTASLNPTATPNPDATPEPTVITPVAVPSLPSRNTPTPSEENGNRNSNTPEPSPAPSPRAPVFDTRTPSMSPIDAESAAMTITGRVRTTTTTTFAPYYFPLSYVLSSAYWSCILVGTFWLIFIS